MKKIFSRKRGPADAGRKGGLKNPPFYIEILLVSAALAILVGWFFKDALFSNKIFVERDLSRYYYPLRYFAVTCVKSGIFPFWNPYIFCGNPLFASLQSCVLYPLSIIYYLGDFTKMFNIFLVMHFFLAGMFTYIFSRQIGCSKWGSFLSGAAFVLSGYMTSVVNLLTTLSAVAWFPLAMLFYYRMTKYKKYKDAIILGIVFTLMFLGGEPSILYMVIFLFFCGAVYFTIEDVVERRGEPVCSSHKGQTHRFAPTYYVKTMLLAVAVFLGLSSFQLLPFWEFLRASGRTGGPANYEMASLWNLPLKDTPGIILPFFHDVFRLFSTYWQRQAWLDNYYVGILVFFLFLAAIYFDRSKKARALFILCLVGFAIALGKDTALFEFLFRFLPGFKIIRYSIRFFFIPIFAICVLAGFGLDYYARFARDPRTKKAAFFILAAAFLSSIAFFCLHFYFKFFYDLAMAKVYKVVCHSSMPRFYLEHLINSQSISKFINADLINLKRAFLLIIFFGSLFYFGTKKAVRINIFIVPWLVFLAITDIFQINDGYYILFDAKKFTTPPSNVDYLRKEQNKTGELFRICCSPQTSREHAYVPEADFYDGLEASKGRLIPNRMVEFGIYDANMYGSVYIRRNSRFMNLVMDKKSKNLEKLLALLNVRFVASSKEPKAIGFKLANKSGPANLYETNNYLPRAFLAKRAVVIKDEEEILAKLKEGEFDPANEVILEEYVCVPTHVIARSPVQYTGSRLREGATKQSLSPEIASLPSVARNDEYVNIISYTPNKIIIEANVADKPKFLVLSDTYYPGWKAYVDGKRQQILRADYIFRAVYLGQGRHIIEFVYSPLSFKLGLILSLITSLIVLTILCSYNIIISYGSHKRAR